MIHETFTRKYVRRPQRRGLYVCLAALVIVVVGGCPSPVNDDAISALGDECDGVDEGPFHRPGQPCVHCHGDYNLTGPTMSMAGTIYATPTDKIPVENAIVTLTDATGQSVSERTNCSGTFYITEEAWVPVFPVHAEIECPIPGQSVGRRSVMGTRISRDGACAGCHVDKASIDSPGWVYCSTEMPNPPYVQRADCEGICQ